LDVTLRVLDELAASDTLPRVGLEEVRRHVVEERELRRSTMLKRLADVDVEKLGRRVASVSAALERDELARWRDALASRVLNRAKSLGTAIAEAGRMYSPEHLHQVRISVKKLRYVLEIASETGTRSATAPVRVLERVQDTLGRLHDLQVLQAHVAAVQANPPGRSLPQGALPTVARALEDQCRHLHGRYVASVPRLLELVASMRRLVVPQIAHPPRAKRRPLKMNLDHGSRRRAKIGAV
jgi:CHAD domain-containing protein